jgi:hypothetical protein
MIATAKNVLAKWLEAVNSGDVEELLSLYDTQAVLIPTFSNRLLNTPEKQRGYFEQLSSREKLSVTLHEKTLLVQEITDKIFVLSGIYNWRFNIDDEPINFEARFSYTLDLANPSPILHHHSSQIPRML